jgi:hypothetical protein
MAFKKKLSSLRHNLSSIFSRLKKYLRHLLFPIYLFPVKLITYGLYYLIKLVLRLLISMIKIIIDMIIFPFRSLKNFLKTIFILSLIAYILVSLFVMADYIVSNYGRLSKFMCEPRLNDKLRHSVVRIVGGYSEGSGFFIGKYEILTSFHVINGEPSPKIIFSDGTFTTAKSIVGDKDADLAIITIDEPQPLGSGDILTKDDQTGLWDLREVKSGTSVKEEYLVDIAFQRICFERAGIKIGKTFLIHINNQYVRQGEIEFEKLLVTEDVTREVLEHKEAALTQIEEAKKIIASTKTPDLLLIRKCHDPKKCDYLSHYIHGFPEVYGLVDSFPDEHLKVLLDRGVLDHTRLSRETLDRVGYISPVPFEEIDSKGIKKELNKLIYPLYFFDYETYGPAIPPFDGLRPYQAIPFQYSLHIQKDKGGPVEHREFLARSFVNPMPELLEKLKQDIGPTGSVIVWNQTFETSRNKEMAVMYPESAEFLTDLNSRMFDLMNLFKFKRKLYRHSEFAKSHSLKSVLLVICPELSYESLEIKEGGTASASWAILTSEQTSAEEKERLTHAMLEYCGRDTEAMVCILKHLETKT